jgi:hypothetical protein
MVWYGTGREKSSKKFTTPVRGRYIVRFEELLTYLVTIVQSKNVGHKITYQSD